MNFFKIEGNGFVICLGIILLLTGLIMFYVKQRFAVYDKLLSEQNKLLKHVVSNIENMSTQHFQSVRDLSNPNALTAAANAIKNIRQVELNENNDNSHNKYPAIVVSDDEETNNDEDDEDDDDDEDDEDESEASEDESSEQKSQEMSDPEVVSTNSNKTKILKIDNFNFNSIKHLQSSQKSNSNSHDESNSYNDSESEDDDSDSSDDNQLVIRKNDNYAEIKVVELDLPIEKQEFKQENEVSDLIVENLTTNSTNENSETKNNYNTIDKLNINDLNDDMKHNVSKKIDLADSVEAGVLSTYKKNKLEELCKDKNLSTKGTRMELIKRLLEHKEDKEHK